MDVGKILAMPLQPAFILDAVMLASRQLLQIARLFLDVIEAFGQVGEELGIVDMNEHQPLFLIFLSGASGAIGENDGVAENLIS